MPNHKDLHRSLTKNTVCLALALSTCHIASSAQLPEASDAYPVRASNEAFYAQPPGGTAYSEADAATLLNRLVALPECHSITFLPGDYPIKGSLRLKSGLRLSGNQGARIIQQHNGDLIAGGGVVGCQIVGFAN